MEMFPPRVMFLGFSFLTSLIRIHPISANGQVLCSQDLKNVSLLKESDPVFVVGNASKDAKKVVVHLNNNYADGVREMYEKWFKKYNFLLGKSELVFYILITNMCIICIEKSL